jgi:hypothetical protein
MGENYQDLLSKKASWMKITNNSFLVSMFLFAVLCGVLLLKA